MSNVPPFEILFQRVVRLDQATDASSPFFPVLLIQWPQGWSDNPKEKADWMNKTYSWLNSDAYKRLGDITSTCFCRYLGTMREVSLLTRSG